MASRHYAKYCERDLRASHYFRDTTFGARRRLHRCITAEEYRRAGTLPKVPATTSFERITSMTLTPSGAAAQNRRFIHLLDNARAGISGAKDITG